MKGHASDDEIAYIKALLLTKKYSARAIAEMIGRTRGSVCGIIWRTPELMEIGLPQQNRNPARKKGEREAHTEALKEAQKTEDGRSLVYGRRLLTRPLPLTMLASHHCRFPMWAHDAHPGPFGLFCAEAKTEDSSYCEHHRQICRSAVRRGVL